MMTLLANVLFIRKLLPLVFLLPIVGYAQLTDGYYKKAFGLSESELADTLYVIAREGRAALYNGSLTQHLLKDLQAHGNAYYTLSISYKYNPSSISYNFIKSQRANIYRYTNINLVVTLFIRPYLVYIN